MTFLLLFGASFQLSWVSWLLNFIETRRASFDTSNITNYIEITQSCQKPVYLLNVQEAHKEYNSLTDWIWAKYEQLDSGEYGSVDTPAFKAEACELANLLASVSQFCQKLNLPPRKELYRPTVFKHWRCFSVLNYKQAVWLGCGGCSFVCRYLRITRLLSAPLVLRIVDWLCVFPAITLVVWQVQES